MMRLAHPSSCAVVAGRHVNIRRGSLYRPRRRVKWAGNCHRIDGGPLTGVPIHVEGNRIGLPNRLEHCGRFVQEGDCDFVRAGLDRQAEVEVLVDMRIVVFARIVGARALGQRLYREHLDPFAVDRQLQFVLFSDRILTPPLTSKTLDVLVAIPVETYLNS